MLIMYIPSSEVEALQSFLDYTGGEVLKETRIRKRADSCGEDQHGDTSELNTGNKITHEYLAIVYMHHKHICDFFKIICVIIQFKVN